MNFLKLFFSDINTFELNMPSIRIIDFLDIIIVAYIIYKIIFWIKETRAWVLFKGILVILGFMTVSYVLKLNTILWLLSKTISVGIIALLVVFQPELRKALEQLGKGNMLMGFLRPDTTDEKSEMKVTEEIIKACGKMSEVRTGALIVIEKSVPLGDHERTGIPIDAIVTNQLLINIFEKNTPLHDGAVIIRNNRVTAATCFLPLTESREISMELGTRHRAAIGTSEVSDALIVVVSEETGAISVAKGGILYRNLNLDTLRSMLSQSSKSGKKKFDFLKKGWWSNEKNT
ncbi:MAG: diadenylate cyclase CdaA [Lachnospiraceae bacterium]|nr:diadenylate cyclase CdaA [Lachnospiraceae bacterium]